MKTNPEITEIKEFRDGELIILGEISDTEDGFAWRLRIKNKGVFDQISKWNWLYEGFASINHPTDKDISYVMCSYYWGDVTFPAEQPFKITKLSV